MILHKLRISIALFFFCHMIAAASFGRIASLRAGAAQVDISPPKFPVRVNAMFTERSASAVVDPLYAKALVLDDGKVRLAICVVDTCMMPRDLIDKAKSEASRRSGIPVERMLVSATHTHSAPSAMACLGSREDPAYAAFLPGRIAEAIVRASQSLQPARIGWAQEDDWQHTFNRRWIRRPDRILTDPFGNPTARAHMHPGYLSPDALGPSGPVDPQFSILAVKGLDGRVLAALANYSQHYYGSPLLSSDYFGRFSTHLSASLNARDDFVGIMSQGTSGDLMWMDYGAPVRDIGYDAYGKELANLAARLITGMKWRDSVPLSMAETTVDLRWRTPSEDRMSWARGVAETFNGRLPNTLPEIYALEALFLHNRPAAALKLQALRIGDLGITAIPNEVFAITGLKLKRQSPLKQTFNIELANGAEGYIPPPEQHRLGGYTTWPARTAGLEESAEPKIVEMLLRLLEKVAGRRRERVVDNPGHYTRLVMRSRPRAYWRLNEMQGDIARDSAGRNHVRFEGGYALYLPGVGSGSGVSPNPALSHSQFSGGGQINRSVHLAGGLIKAAIPNLGKEYTLELWIWNGLPTELRSKTGVIAAIGGVEIGIGGIGTEKGKLYLKSESIEARVGSIEVPVKQWQLVTLARTSNEVRIYVNGELQISFHSESVPASEIVLGGGSDGQNSFEGRIDEAAVYPNALSPSAIRDRWITAALN